MPAVSAFWISTWYCTKSPTAATSLFACLLTKTSTVVGSTGTSTCTGSPAATMKSAPREAVDSANGAPVSACSCGSATPLGNAYAGGGVMRSRYVPGSTTGKRYVPLANGICTPAPSVAPAPLTTVVGNAVTPSSENTLPSAGWPVTASSSVIEMPSTASPVALLNTREPGSTTAVAVTASVWSDAS